jgi:hypothetical protein
MINQCEELTLQPDVSPEVTIGINPKGPMYL